MLVESIMTRGVHTVSPDETLGTMYEIFKQVPYRHLLVEHEGKLLGVVSDRDIAQSMSPFFGTKIERANDRQIMERIVADTMSVDIVSVEKDAHIDTASILLLENNISCLPVVSDGECIEGILTWKDILNYHVYGKDEEDRTIAEEHWSI